MSSFSNRRTQTATHWKNQGRDKNQEAQFSAPATISVRWESKSGRRYNNAEDNEATQLNANNAVLIDPDLDIDIGDWLFLGTSSQSDPRSVTGAKEVQQINNIPNLTGTKATSKAIC